VQEIIDKSKKFVLNKYSKYNGKFGPQFMKFVTEESIKLADTLSKGTDLNKSALLLGIYLHDIGRTVTDSQEHTIEGKKIAESFFKDNHFKDERILEIIFDCILNHGSEARPTTNEGKLVQFIDKAVLINPKIISNILSSLK
jgi:HD superfamily phosphodiesterase